MSQGKSMMVDLERILDTYSRDNSWHLIIDNHFCPRDNNTCTRDNPWTLFQGQPWHSRDNIWHLSKVQSMTFLLGTIHVACTRDNLLVACPWGQTINRFCPHMTTIWWSITSDRILAIWADNLNAWLRGTTPNTRLEADNLDTWLKQTTLNPWLKWAALGMAGAGQLEQDNWRKRTLTLLKQTTLTLD